MKILLTLVLVVFCAYALLPIPIHGQLGDYNVLTQIAYCSTEDVCLHEFAHHLDQEQGWISQSPAYSEALQLYLYTELRKPSLEKMPSIIMAMGFGNDTVSSNREIYADMYEWAKGKESNMPVGLRPFYNWNKSLNFYPKFGKLVLLGDGL